MIKEDVQNRESDRDGGKNKYENLLGSILFRLRSLEDCVTDLRIEYSDVVVYDFSMYCIFEK
jgi:hypothetical protein